MPNNLIQRQIDPKDLARVSVAFQEAGYLFDYITQAITEVEQSVRAKAMADDFGKGDWAYRQAYLLGQLKALDFCKQLITR